MAERWLPVVGYANFYEVSDEGRVRSFPRCVGAKGGRTRIRGAAFLKPIYLGSDYWKIDLTDAAGVKRRRKLHHLVLEAFVGPRPDGLLALHRDDDRSHNALSNLYWGTRSENVADCKANGKHRPGISLGEKHGQSKLKEADIPRILALYDQGVPIRRIASRFGVTDMPIHDIIRGKTWGWLTGIGRAA